MSAFILDAKRIASLAEFITTLNNVGFDFFGFSIPESLNIALDCGRFAKESEIFNKLYAFNVEAVNGRYNEENITSAEMPKNYKTLYKFREYDFENRIEIIEPWHYELYKLLQCFIYQCCEDQTYNTPLYKALQELENRLAQYIVMNNINYSKADWG